MDPKKDELKYHHFSHDHPLDYTKLQPHRDASCAGCRQPIAPNKFYYRCKLCGFYLHQVCFSMPENVTHPSDPNHHLTLETFPTQTKVPVRCKGCETPIKGFYYHCPKCVDYYHTLCLAAPLSVKTSLHRHALNIEFVPVYDFQCDLCDKPSYSGWVYHCNLCEFDAHLSCVLRNTGAAQPRVEPLGSAAGNTTGGNNQRQDELMELLTRSSNVVQSQSQSQSQSQDQSMQSFQLSEACFSIDFQNSLIGDDGGKVSGGRGDVVVVREVGIPEDKRMYGGVDDSEGFEESSRRSEKSRGSSYGRKSVSMSSSGVIGAHIWSELEQATEKRNSKAGERRELDNRRPSTSLPKFMCCFKMGKIIS